MVQDTFNKRGVVAWLRIPSLFVLHHVSFDVTRRLSWMTLSHYSWTAKTKQMTHTGCDEDLIFPSLFLLIHLVSQRNGNLKAMD
jgi:hypothetical protein